MSKEHRAPSLAKTMKAAGLALAVAGASALAWFSGRVEMAAPHFVQPAVAAEAAFSDEQKKAIGEIVKDYLIKNPEVLIEIQSALESKMEKEQSEKLKHFMSENAKDIYRKPDSPVA
ncbi:MAG: DsbA family protein, partial [Hyphomicrobium sp.]